MRRNYTASPRPGEHRFPPARCRRRREETLTFFASGARLGKSRSGPASVHPTGGSGYRSSGRRVPIHSRKEGSGILGKGMEAKEWERGIFCLHSFASIPLPNQFRRLGFRFTLCMPRSTGRLPSNAPGLRFFGCDGPILRRFFGARVFLTSAPTRARCAAASHRCEPSLSISSSAAADKSTSTASSSSTGLRARIIPNTAPAANAMQP